MSWYARMCGLAAILLPGCSGYLFTDAATPGGTPVRPAADGQAIADPSHDLRDGLDLPRLMLRLDLERYKDRIYQLAAFGDRRAGSGSNARARIWLITHLEGLGYRVGRHRFRMRDGEGENLYVTKVGTTRPNDMWIVSAHLDGRGGGGGADDDASGSALVLEIADALANPLLETETSVRFVWWDAEEDGLAGSENYVDDRKDHQGERDELTDEFEPNWLGMIQHDMVLFDHGLPPQPEQSPNADIDVEYASSAFYRNESADLALALSAAAQAANTAYPVEIGDNMTNTDSWSFRDVTASVSVRENQREAEIGEGSNPHWHQPTDVYDTYSDDDFRLGFSAAQMTLSAVCALAGLQVAGRRVCPTAGPAN